jgi:hypothetical protein
MNTTSEVDTRIVEGIQLRILAQVFPVLRHETVKPLSNAKLTTVLLEKAIAKGTIIAPDAPPFVSDLENMLDEGVESIRVLSNWFSDDGAAVPAHTLINECRKLAFSLLLMSGKKVRIEEFGQPQPIPHYSSRYVLMAWLVQAIQSLPDRGVLQVEQGAAGQIRARALPAPPDAPPARPPSQQTRSRITAQDMAELAAFYGWTIEQNGDEWLLSVPAPRET